MKDLGSSKRILLLIWAFKSLRRWTAGDRHYLTQPSVGLVDAAFTVVWPVPRGDTICGLEATQGRSKNKRSWRDQRKSEINKNKKNKGVKYIQQKKAHINKHTRTQSLCARFTYCTLYTLVRLQFLCAWAFPVVPARIFHREAVIGTGISSVMAGACSQ